jgi:hypothetical protein
MEAMMRKGIRGSLLATVLGLGLPVLGWCQFQGGATVVGAPSPDQDALGAKDANDLKKLRGKQPHEAAQASAKVSDSDRAKLGIQAAQDLLKDKKYAEVLAKLREVDAIPGKTPFDSYVLERTRLAAAAQLNDNALMYKTIEAVLATGQTPPDEEVKFADITARHYFNDKDYPQAIAWINRYYKAGGNDEAMRRSLLYSYFMTNDHARVVQEIRADIQADEKASRTPAEYELKLLASSAQKLNDQATYDMAVAKYASYYAKK